MNRHTFILEPLSIHYGIVTNTHNQCEDVFDVDINTGTFKCSCRLVKKCRIQRGGPNLGLIPSHLDLISSIHPLHAHHLHPTYHIHN